MNEPVLLLCNGGHGAVIRDTLQAMGREVVAAVDDPWVLDWMIEQRQVPRSAVLALGLGGDLAARARLATLYRDRGYSWATVIHPSAVVSSRATIGEGAQILAGAVIQAGATVGRDSIINTNASVDHHCSIGECCHIGPGATLCGSVAVGPLTMIGAGAIVTPARTIGRGCLVKAGARLSHDLQAGARFG